ESALGPRALRFRADRADRASGGEIWTDYKSGKPISTAKGADARLKAHREQIARGRALQAFAYALAPGARRTGRYGFLRARVDDEQCALPMVASDAAARALYDEASETILATWDLGALFPRLVGARVDESNRDCARCEMAIACLRGDSGAQARLAAHLRA